MNTEEKLPIIGQDKLVKETSRIFQIFKNSNGLIKPHFILTGSSGSGKTFTIQTLAAKHEMLFIEVNAAQLTKEGTSGNSLSKALTPLLQTVNKNVVVFVDEFDKLFISGNSNNQLAHEVTSGVQNEFLKLLEGNTTQVFGDYGKYVTVGLERVLFVFAGAFNGEPDMTLDKLRTFGVKTEFLGRVGLIYNAKTLTEEDLFKIVDNSVLIHQYCKLFPDTDKETVQLYIKGYVQKHNKDNALGARMINTLVQQFFIGGGVINIKEPKKEIFIANTLKLKED